MSIEIQPQRLAARDDVVGDALRAALDELPTREAAPAPFSSLLSDYTRRTRQRRTGLAALAAACALASWYFGQSGGQVFERGATQSSSISAEDPSRFGEAIRPVLDSQPRPPEQHAFTRPKQATPAKQAAANPRIASATTPSRSGEQPLDIHQESIASAAGLSACQTLLREGAYERAVSCYETQGQGTGVSAELAWLERARVERRALRAPERALATLSAYTQRFSAGALRPEASLSRLELLDELGHVEQALELVDLVLTERLAPSREGELRAIKARLLARANRCVEAENSLAEALRVGASAHYAAAVHEHCAK